MSRVVVVDEVLCEKVLRTSEGQCNVLDFSFCGKRKCVGGATLFCGERRDARREETIHRVLLRRPCPVLSLLSLFLSSRRSTLMSSAKRYRFFGPQNDQTERFGENTDKIGL